MQPVQSSGVLDDAEQALTSRDLTLALRLFSRAQADGADPDRCSAGRWETSMLLGDLEAAWQESDAIRQRGGPDPHRLWQGEPLGGKRVIVRSLHGFGDAVQFLRYATQLRTRAASLLFEVPPRFTDLAHCIDGVDEVITWGRGAPTIPPLWDVQIEVMELPYLFRTRLADLPLSTRYLNLGDPASRPPQPKALQVGLCWTAGGWNPARSLEITRLWPLSHVPGCSFWSLQSDAHPEPEFPVSLQQDEAARTSLLGLARRISQLDLVITVDSLPAHLAGALGVPAWVLLQHAADWRWMHGRSDSPWYPSIRLFRQPAPGDWSSVIASVTQALQAVSSTKQVGATP